MFELDIGHYVLLGSCSRAGNGASASQSAALSCDTALALAQEREKSRESARAGDFFGDRAAISR